MTETNNVSANIKKERSSNFELLRIIAMMLIVFRHLFYQGCGMFDTTGINQIFAFFFGSAGRISINLFLFLGCWFMVDSTFKAGKVLKLYLELWLYNFIITVFMMTVIHAPLPSYTWVKAFTPYIHSVLWFATAYIFLMTISPFLQKFFEFRKSKQEIILLSATISIPLCSTIHLGMDTFLDAFLYFIYAFLLIGYLKHNVYPVLKFNKYISLLLGLGIYVSMVSLKYISYIMQTKISFLSYVYEYMYQYLRDFKSIPNILCALLIFYFFSKINIGSNKTINFFAKGAFAVYIIHQVPCFYDFLWHTIFRCDYWANSRYFILYSVLVVFITYIVCVLIDMLRVKYVEPHFVNSKLYKTIENIINDKYSDIQSGSKQV